MKKYHVTCPECGRKTITEWSNELAPGGIDPVECECGFWILSESDGNPVEVETEIVRTEREKPKGETK